MLPVRRGSDTAGMPIPLPWLLPAYVLSAALTVLAASGVLDLPLLPWLTKPLTTALVIVLAWQRGAAGDSQRRAVIAGLVLSWLGDVALLWPQGFVAGLVAFLLAHLAYLLAFTRRVPLASRWLPFALYALVAGGVAAWVWPGVPAALRLPVLAYVACLGSMAAQAAVQWLGLRGTADGGLARLAAFGGALFVVSDSLLAINRFLQPLPASSLWILASYWAAQWLIASSLPPRRGG